MRNPFTDLVNLDTLIAIMKDAISSNIISRDIITKKLHQAKQNKAQRGQDITNPESLSDGVSNGTILSFSGGPRDGGLLLGCQETRLGRRKMA